MKPLSEVLEGEMLVLRDRIVHQENVNVYLLRAAA